MASWRKAEEALSRKRAIRRGDDGPGNSNSLDTTPINGTGGGGRERQGKKASEKMQTGWGDMLWIEFQ